MFRCDYLEKIKTTTGPRRECARSATNVNMRCEFADVVGIHRDYLLNLLKSFSYGIFSTKRKISSLLNTYNLNELSLLPNGYAHKTQPKQKRTDWNAIPQTPEIEPTNRINDHSFYYLIIIIMAINFRFMTYVSNWNDIFHYYLISI